MKQKKLVITVALKDIESPSVGLTVLTEKISNYLSGLLGKSKIRSVKLTVKE